ncbi:MAG: DUF1538 domain-containing protein [Oscillospiraceae bacterium]|jgi:hypothetical protein|nr:DUF1538 domain-containing protein [Oscillospiraceae bacterium]
MKKNLVAKIKESLSSALPITVIVLILAATIAPVSGEMMCMFLIGAAMLVIGIGLFTLGADTSMMVMGEKIGAGITRTKKLPLILFTCLFIGIMITVAEPDLRVLAEQTSIAENMTLILAVAIGVGLFLVVAFLRIMLKLRLSVLLFVFYLGVFVLALSPLTQNEFIPVAFDSGGVTTGPISVPFIMALGVGLASIRGDKSSQDDTFGLVALCSIGPIVTVLILGAIAGGGGTDDTVAEVINPADTQQVVVGFLHAFPEQFADVALAVAPIVGICLIFQLAMIKMSMKHMKRVIVGFLFTYFGLVIFLTGVNVGFLPMGMTMGEALGGGKFAALLVPIGAIMGYFIVTAEPAVHVLKKQAEDVTNGVISGKTLGLALSIGVGVAVALAMLRVLTGMNILWLIIPGYAFSLIISFFVPPIYTAIAFDSGGVASGPMTATFLLPFAIGACVGVGGNIATDAFGMVTMVALAPLITIQILGFYGKYFKKHAKPAIKYTRDMFLPEEIIDLV